MASENSTRKELVEGEVSSSWNVPDEVSQRLDIPLWTARNTIELLDQDHTIPFIARYRKEKTGNMEADKIRDVKDVYEELKSVQAKCASVIKTINKLGKLTASLKSALRSSRTLSEIEHLYQPFKPGNKRSYAERARELGLEKAAMKVIQNPQKVNMDDYVNPSKEGLKSRADVEKGVKHILADIIAKDKEVLSAMRQSMEKAHIMLESTKSRAVDKKKKQDNKTERGGGGGGGGGGGSAKRSDDSSKFEHYFNFSIPAKYAKPHQVLAINRGENMKALSVKINVSDQVKQHLNQQAHKQFVHHTANGYTRKLIQDSFDDSYSRLLHPLMTRKLRSELTKTAEKASVEVFASNLKKLLLMPPVRGRVVLGVDPGFRNGSKWVITSETGRVLDTGIEYLRNNGFGNINKLKEVMLKHRCHTVAIGNGTACRETETAFTEYIKKGTFAPLNLVYCIVSESGASIYSASDLAKKEMPELDISLRGAVSIARRLQDPLAELVKIEPKHIGVGMYQHDVSESQLKTTLDSVVEECVSFVGVDINVCSEVLLRRVAGLNAARAKKIVDWREKNGAFQCREQLKTVTGIGPKTYEQCAGFVRVLPETRTSIENGGSEVDGGVCSIVTTGKKRKAATSSGRGGKKAKLSATVNPLDQTCIHPESYEITERFLQKVGLSKDGIGEEDFINKMKQFVKCQTLYLGASSLAAELGVGQPTMELIINGLTQPVHFDMREDFEKPLFKKGLTSIEDLRVGGSLTGRVTNTTHFGAFVDIGVGKDALIHVSKMPRTLLNGKASLELGDKVEVTILNIEIDRQRIQLGLNKLL